MQQRLLGQILTNFHVITEDDLRRCLKIQEQSSAPVPLGKILLDEGLISEKLLQRVLSAQRQSLDPKSSKLEMSSGELGSYLEQGGVREYLEVARRLGASDLYLSSGKPPTVRLNGKLSELPMVALDLKQCQEMIFGLLQKTDIENYYERKSVDTAIDLGEIGRFRVNVFRHFGGIGAVFRVLPGEVATAESLGLPANLRSMADYKTGLVLITGTTGSGKSTTLTALIDLVNRTSQRHVITLEDPIESVFKSDQGLVTQRDLSTVNGSFSDALRSVLREDPDVIVVGEMRDPETVATALTAAETGHLVFGTLHTRNAHSTVVRIIDQFPAEKRAHVRTMLAGVLRAVICQELVPNIEGTGRCLATEVMIVNAAISNLIREAREWQIPMVMQMNKSAGSHLMDDSLLKLIADNQITVEDALTRAADRARFMAPA